MTSPAHWEADVIASDGGPFHLRPIAPSDAAALVAFHANLSPRTRYLRYFSAYPTVPESDLKRFTNHDFHYRVGLVALLGDEVIAIGRYEGVPGSDSAEVAFVVADEHQGRGIGSVLLEHLAAAARERGIARFSALVLAENGGMLRVFRDAGYQVAHERDGGEVTLEFDVRETATTSAVMREREQRAEARSIRRLLHPSTVAVVGASNSPDKVGNAVFGHLLQTGFHGTLYPVNPATSQVASVRAYPSILDIAETVDLVVVAVPGPQVAEVVQQCAHKGVHGVVVISSGFGERGDEASREAGHAAQREMVATARRYGMRVIGPNCLGVINTDPDVLLNASLAPMLPPRGRAGFFCQSGALGAAVLAEAARRGLGVSTFVSAGNRADVSGNDLLQYWETDESTSLALLYLESFGNPRKFARLARRLSRRKPIVVVRGARGTIAYGLQGATVHLPEEALQALFEASGVIRVDTLDDLFDVGVLLSSQPLPRGDRIAVVTNSSALGVLVANACVEANLPVPVIADIGTEATPQAFATALAQAFGADTVDSVIAVFVPPLQRIAAGEYAAVLRAAAATASKPVVSTFLGLEGVSDAPSAPGEVLPPVGSVPSYPTPERAVRALAHVLRYARWRRRPPSVVPDLPGLALGRARELVEAMLDKAPSGRALDAAEATELLACVGITLDTDSEVAGTAALLGVHDDRSFGGLVWFGLAGVAIELFRDIAYAAVPLTAADADDLISTPRAAPLLIGRSGTAPADRDALAATALRLSALSEELPELRECRLTLIATSDGVVVRSASASVAPATARADTGPRRFPGL